jgi:uncharacterized protein (TIGR02231 family)
MRMLPTTLLALLATASPVLAGELDVSSSIDNVTVYPDGATVTRVIRADLPAGDTTLTVRDFPPLLDPASLRVEGAGRLTIGAIDARPPRPERPATNPELEKRIEALQDERGTLDDKIAAADARRKFAQRFAESSPTALGEKGEARPLAEWRAAFAVVADEITTADAAIHEAKLRQRDVDRELARLDAARKANPTRKMEVRIDLAAEAAGNASLRVTYSVRGARWVPLYDARLDTGAPDRKPALELVRRAEILQQTGEDWNDVALTVSTVRTAKGGSAPSLSPLLVRYPEPPRPLAAAPVSGGMEKQSSDKRQTDGLLASAGRPRSAAQEEPAPPPAPEQEADADTGGFQAVFHVPGRVSIAANEGAKSFRVSTATIAPDLIVRATPALDETAYLEAGFKQNEEAPLLPGRIALYRDGVFVGRGQMALTPKGETARLGFGADDKVKVARALLRKQQSQTGIISSAKVDEREFKITLRNGHATPVHVGLEDQLPVSEIDDVKVELLPVTTPPSERDVKDRRGVLAWSFDAAAGEQREIRLGWRVRWPADKVVVYEARR